MTQDTYHIHFDDLEIKYKLRRDKRAKRFRIIIHDDGLCVVTVPFPFGKPSAEKFLQEQISWIRKNIHKQKTSRKLLSGYFRKEEYIHLKERSRNFVLRELKVCNTIYNFSYTGVSIRNQRTRWGSCSSQGRLNFHYKLILLPRRLARYVIVHELCHLKEMNHSSRFWALVEKSIPEYRECRKELKEW